MFIQRELNRLDNDKVTTNKTVRLIELAPYLVKPRVALYIEGQRGFFKTLGTLVVAKL